MKLIVTLALLLAAGSVMGQPKPVGSWRWPRYKVEQERFAVALPAPPSMGMARKFSDRLKKERLEQTLQAKADGVFYRVFIFSDSKSYTFEDFVAEYDVNFKWDASTERQLTVNGAKGREFQSQDKNATTQVFVKDDRFYGFIVTGAGAADEKVKLFFNSIEFGKNPDGVEISEVPGATLYAEPVTDVYKTSELDKRLILRSKPEPEYSAKGRSKGVNGIVILRAVFTGDGRVVNIRVVKALPYRMTDAAIEAARKIKFEPAMKDGKTVSMWLQLEYNFNIY